MDIKKYDAYVYDEKEGMYKRYMLVPIKEEKKSEIWDLRDGDVFYYLTATGEVNQGRYREDIYGNMVDSCSACKDKELMLKMAELLQKVRMFVKESSQEDQDGQSLFSLIIPIMKGLMDFQKE